MTYSNSKMQKLLSFHDDEQGADKQLDKLFEKCKAALGSYKTVRKFEEKLILRNLFFIDGRLDVKRYRSTGMSLGELSQIPDFQCVILFSAPNVPPIKCRFKRALQSLNEIMQVSAVFWIMNERFNYVVEFYRGTASVCELRN